MKHRAEIKKLLWTTLKCAVLGAALSVGGAFAADLVLNGDAQCTQCHDAETNADLLAIGQTKHGVRADNRTPSCTSCHGESEQHLAKKGKVAPDAVFKKGAFAVSDAKVQNDSCMSCHTKDANRTHWEGGAHQTAGVACASCHQVHAAQDKVLDKRTQSESCFSCHKAQRAQVNKPSHHPVLEGKVSCSDCHNVHGSTGPSLMKRNSVVETCYTCHMEKRGPFIHSHQPVNEDCSTCHNPHGTTTENLLKSRPPFLCNSCHTPHGPIQPALSNGTAPGLVAPGWWNPSVITQGKSCVSCHSQIHGSSNPSAAGQRFLR